ncbi:hypothetical protein JYB62_00750 [Algoriphagus lutimaris]|uniref:hypothetical protein n=1 Tax=Algoriphagus lutimaris TaxID=613197 RepID=UPI00196B05BF|nr:hypothetical protein [Algoriphagus lutimaris]MBN3518514.1 hypothetical protein [Algoriphagus lutimaris]
MSLKTTILLSCALFFYLNSIAQDKAYFNQTELGFLYGKGSEQWDGSKENRIDVSFITFHGVRITKNHVIGFSTGLDQYNQLSIIPLALGWRGFLGKTGKPNVFAGLDIGGGSALLEKKEENEWSKSWYEGGYLVSPSFGASFPAKKGKSALTLSFAYKRQQISQFVGTFLPPGSPSIPTDLLPPGFSTFTENDFLFRSFVFRAGLLF